MEKELEHWSTGSDTKAEEYFKRLFLHFGSSCAGCSKTLQYCLNYCIDCGPLCAYCPSCATEINQKMIFHTPLEVLVSSLLFFLFKKVFDDLLHF